MADALVPVAAGARLRHRVTWVNDDPADHQIRIRTCGTSSTRFLVGCACTDDTIALRWEASDAEMREAWALVAHRHPDRTTPTTDKES